MQGFKAGWYRKLALLTPAPYKPWHHCLRISVGTGLPLLAGVLSNDIAPFLYIALGAFLTEVTTRLGRYRERFRMIAISTAIGATGCLIGPAIAGHGLMTLIVLVLVGFASGIISSYGAAFSTGALYMLVLAIVHASTASSMPAWAVGACFAAGAALVTAMLAVEALADRDRPERVLRANLIRALAGLARAQDRAAAETARRAVTDQTKAAYDMLIEMRSHDAGRTRDMARTADMLSLAHQLTMAIIGAHRDRKERQTAADMLDAVADAHEANGRQPTLEGDGELTRLCRQLSDTLWRTNTVEGGSLDATERHLPRFSRAALQTSLRKLVVGREVIDAALRLALCIGIAEIAGRFVSGDHAYWVPITVAIIMKPDFGSVFVRAVHRSIGTVIGVLIGMALIELIPDRIGLVAAIAVLAALQPLAALRSYATKVVLLTPVVLLMIEIAVPATPFHYGLQRLDDTLVGAAIVLVFGYLIWPRSQNVTLASAFAASSRAVADFLAAASDGGAEGAGKTLGETEFAAYRKLSDLRTQLQKFSAEPPPAGREAASWFPAVVGAERLCDAIAVYAEGQRLGDPTPDPERITRVAQAMADLNAHVPQTKRIEKTDRFTAVEAEIDWLADYLRNLPSA
ncbi:FUSC family protein [Martelella sp. AMO21009]